ncbi:hypothetical protein C8R46DRAFT_898427, partial [Mycena filopes]
KSEPVSNPKARRGATTPPPSHTIIDLSGSSPLQPPKIQKRTRSPSLPESSASTARPKRKLTSLPPSSVTGSPPPKRSRTATPAHKHQAHWALDGSIVIQIEDTKFKLHKSHLVKHSPWFSGLFDGQKVEGGRYVELEEDDSTPMYTLSLPTLTAKDFARLLDAFDNAILYVHEDPSLSRIASILRVATLLSFPDFRDWAIHILQERWSPALEDLSTDRITFATESIVLARTCDVPGLLKRALYELVRLAGFGQHDRVTSADLGALLHAREQLTAVWNQITSPYSPALCTTTDPLKVGKLHHKLVRESGIADDFLYDPLCGLQALIEADWEGEGYCEACVRLRREMWTNQRERLWENLNLWFGLT